MGGCPWMWVERERSASIAIGKPTQSEWDKTHSRTENRCVWMDTSRSRRDLCLLPNDRLVVVLNPSTRWFRSSKVCAQIEFTPSHLCFGRGDDTVGNPHRAQISQFELFELFIFYVEIRLNALSSDSSQQHLNRQYPPPLLVFHRLRVFTSGGR